MRGPRTRLVWALLAAATLLHGSTWVGVERAWPGAAIAAHLAAAWAVTIALAVLALRRIGLLTERLSAREDAHRATLDEIEQLQTQNAMLQIVARSVDVPLAFQALAVRIARLVPCDRVGLALLTESGQEFETSTARVQEDERRARPRPDVVFKAESTAIGNVVRTGEPLLVPSLEELAPDLLDLNVLRTAGFRSALIMPLVARGRGVGTLNVVSRTRDAFGPAHIDALRPIAEILAVAQVAQQLHMLVGKYRTIEAMSELTLAIAAEINSALQTITGHCGLLQREYPDPGLQRDLETVVEQAHRVAALLERMRSATHERLREVADTIEERGIPTSPEDYSREPPLTG